MLGYIFISVSALIGYIISTIGGGGGSLLLVPVVSFVLGSRAVAPVLSLGEMLSRPVRLVIFWKYIDWTVVKYHIPGSVVGAVLGAYIFASIELEWLQTIVGLFLISTVFQYGFGGIRDCENIPKVYHQSLKPFKQTFGTVLVHIDDNG